MLVGARDVATRTIRRTFAPAPLDDMLGSARVDWRSGGGDAFMFRYAGEHADDTGASSLDRAIGSASQRQRSRNGYQSIVGTWTRVANAALVNAATVSFSSFDNDIAPVAAGPQLTFPSIQDGSSFRVPQGTTQKRFQINDTVSLVRGAHSLRAGGEWQRVDALFDLGVFREGRVELVEDFATFDHNADGRVDDQDLLFAVTLRSGRPEQALVLPDADNDYVAAFVQDDWRVRRDLTLNLVFATSWTPTSRTSADTERSIRWCSRSCRARGSATATTSGPGLASTGLLAARGRACTAGMASTTTG